MHVGMTDDAHQRTVEGTTWPMVLLAELAGDEVAAWTRALEDANIIVLKEPSIIRAAMITEREKPHVVIVPASLPSERTQKIRSAARDVGADVLTLSVELSASQVRNLVEKSLHQRLKR
jgi:hypothetical protein